MAFGRSIVRCLMLAAVTMVILPGTAAAQVQTSAQQACINALNKSSQKVAQTQGKEIFRCINASGKGKLPTGTDVTDCVTADTKGKVDAAEKKTAAQEDAKCTEAPDFGFRGAAVVNEAAVAQELRLTEDVFKIPLYNYISNGSNPAEAKCQASVSKALEKYAATVFKEFNSCAKSGLKDGSIASRPGLVDCVGYDFKGKGKITGAQTKLQSTIENKCDESLTLSEVFEGKCKDRAGTPEELSTCMADAADCRVCIMLRETARLFPYIGERKAGVDFNCDEFDDGVVNGSCEGCGNGKVERREPCDEGVNNSDEAPDGCRTTCINAFCGDNVLDYGEECDDGNTADGDGCNASCGCEPGNVAPTCQDMTCPTQGQLVLFAGTTGIACANNDDCEVGECDTELGVCTTATALQVGYMGVGAQDVNDQVVLRSDLICEGGGVPCGECQVAGIDPSAGYCRCVNDIRAVCDQPFGVDDEHCNGDLCACYYGPPLPLVAQGTAACVVNVFSEDLRGTANVDTGEGVTSVRLRSVVHLGEAQLTPCPVCGGTCQAGKTGDPCGVDRDCDTSTNSGDGVCGGFDPTPDDQDRQGTCYKGVSHGLSCDVNLYNETFPADPIKGHGGAGMSLDCMPSSLKNVSGDGLRISFEATTGTASLPEAAVVCGGLCTENEDFGCTSNDDCVNAGVGGTCRILLCPCGLCSQDSSVVCTSNDDCVGVGACVEAGAGAPKPNDCDDFICNDTGDGVNGECSAGLDEYGKPRNESKFCDGVTLANGLGLIPCSADSTCAGLGAGTCTMSQLKPCFLDPVSATGVTDPNFPVAVGAFCVARTSSDAINGAAGLPGPGRVYNAGKATTYCASDPESTYTPGFGGCP